jgi:hypothetical protein
VNAHCLLGVLGTAGVVAASLWKYWRNKAPIEPEQPQEREGEEALHGVAALSMRPGVTACALLGTRIAFTRLTPGACRGVTIAQRSGEPVSESLRRWPRAAPPSAILIC